MEPAIHVRDLTRRFGAFTAVDRVTFDVAPGEVFGFLGSNGAGKSTTIRMLCGLLEPTSGSAVVAGVDVTRDPEGVKERIGYMSQRFSLYEQLTVEQNITFFAGVYGLGRAARARRRRDVIALGGLSGKEQMSAHDLPGGWRQRLALACALIHEPRIVFLDEPTGGVDPLSRRDFWNLIERLARDGVTILVTTHYLDEAEHCDRIALIHAGRLAAIGTPGELKRGFETRPIYEVQTTDPVRAMQALEHLGDVDDASLFGTAVHAVGGSDRLTPDILRTAFADAGIDVSSIERVTPSLEDVFLDVVRGGP